MTRSSRNRTTCGAVVLLLALLAALPAAAAAPFAKIPTPGFFRLMLGDFEVTVLSDGTVDLPVDKLLTNSTPEKIAKALARAHLPPPVETSDNSFLINTGSKLVLVDTGAGALFGPTLGKLLTNLKASGYQPEQVDEIYITHMHGDHIGSLAPNGQIAFPNAIVRADKAESDYWLSQANLDQAPADRKGGFEGVRAMLTPYVAAGKYQPFTGVTPLAPGITAEPSHGHTPGHSSYLVESKGQKLLLIGDLIHVGAVQFDEPSVTMAFDSDSKSAEAQRKATFAAAAKGGYLLGATHLSFPGLGYVEASGSGYRWLPVNYGQLH